MSFKENNIDWSKVQAPDELDPVEAMKEAENNATHNDVEDVLQWRAERVNLNDIPPDDPDLIEGVLSLGSKMIVSAPSKADKSWFAINVAESVATGNHILGRSTLKGRVLYVNLEVKKVKFLKRLKAVAKARAFDLDEISDNLDVIHMRGFYKGPEAFEAIVAREIERMLAEKSGEYVLIVIDPLYKLNFDENKAQEVGKVCEAVDKFAEKYGVSVLQVHHHSKGPKGDRAAIDRASGSGVLARDPDCILDILEVFPPDPDDNRLDEGVRGFVFEWSLRDFPPTPPQRIMYKWPIHMIDAKDATADWKPQGSEDKRAAAKAKKAIEKAEKERDFANAQLALAAAFIEQGVGFDEGMPAKDAAVLAGVKGSNASRALTGNIDKYGSSLFMHAKKPGKKPGKDSKENYIFMKVKPASEAMTCSGDSEGDQLKIET